MDVQIPGLLSNRYGIYYFRIHTRTQDRRISLKTRDRTTAIKMAIHIREILMSSEENDALKKMQLDSLGIDVNWMSETAKNLPHVGKLWNGMFKSLGLTHLVPEFSSPSNEIPKSAPKPALKSLKAVEVPAVVHEPPQVVITERKTLFDALALHMASPASKRLAPATLKDRVRHFNQFVATVTNLELRQLDKAKAVEYRNHLMTPSVRGTLGISRANTKLSDIRMVLAAAVESGLIADNPFTGVTAGSKSQLRSQTRSWQRWESNELSKIFNPDTYPISERILSRGPLEQKPSRFWVPLILCTTGSRPEEICQLTLDDIKRTTDTNISYFSISESEEKNQTLKTAQSRRDVPIPTILFTLGFSEYLESLNGIQKPRGRPKSGEIKRLFPDLSYSKQHGWYRNLSRWFNETYLKAIGLHEQPNKRLYSFRSTLINLAYAAGAQTPPLTKIVGHIDVNESGSVHTGTYTQTTIDEKKRILDSVSTEHLNALIDRITTP